VDKVIGSFEEEGRMGMRRSREAGYKDTIPRILSLREVKVEHFYVFFFNVFFPCGAITSTITCFYLFRFSVTLFFILHYCIFHILNLLVMMLSWSLKLCLKPKSGIILCDLLFIKRKLHHSQKHLKITSQSETFEQVQNA